MLADRICAPAGCELPHIETSAVFFCCSHADTEYRDQYLVEHQRRLLAPSAAPVASLAHACGLRAEGLVDRECLARLCLCPLCGGCLADVTSHSICSYSIVELREQLHGARSRKRSCARHETPPSVAVRFPYPLQNPVELLFRGWWPARARCRSGEIPPNVTAPHLASDF